MKQKKQALSFDQFCLETKKFTIIFNDNLNITSTS